MPSGKPIDWTQYDDLLRVHLPTLMITQWRTRFAPHISAKAIGARAKKLGIYPAAKTLSESQKAKLSTKVTKSISVDQYEFIRCNLNILSRKQIATSLGLSLHLVNRAIGEMDLVVDPQIQAILQAERSRGHAAIAAAASSAKWADSTFRESMRQMISTRSKGLWRDESYRLRVRAGIKQTYATTDLRERLASLGRERFLADPTVRQALATEHSSKTSKLNDRVATILQGLGISHEREFELANYKFDFKIGDMLLEVHGDYWHNLPRNIQNDHAKSSMVERYFPQYQLRVIWEHELKSVRALDRLLEVLGISAPAQMEIALDQLQFGEYGDKCALRRFLSCYHYLGDTNRSKRTYALTYHGELIAVAVFGQLIRQNIAETSALELTRLCRHPYFYNSNMLSFLLGKSIKCIKALRKYKMLVSYADTELHRGTVYRATNWVDLGECQPDYQYISDTGVPMHKKTLYNRAKRLGLREAEFAELAGYQKTKTKPKRRFVYYL